MTPAFLNTLLGSSFLSLVLFLFAAIVSVLLVFTRRKCALLQAEVLSLVEKNRLQQALFDERASRLNEYASLASLQADLLDFKERVENCYTQERREVFALKQSIDSLSTLHQKMNDSARELAQSLRGNSKLKGTWGELILERVFEVAGLVAGRDFVKEGSGLGLKSDNGTTRKPDVVVFLPRGRHLLIDAKLNMTQYERLMNFGLADSKTEEHTLLQTHKAEFIQSIKTQVSSLASKEYATISSLHCPEFVFLFIPIEAAFAFIMEQSFETFEWASRKGVILSSPSTLLSMLKMVAFLWKEENQSKNAIEISKRAGKLFDKFTLCMDDLMQMGKELERVSQLHAGIVQRWSHGRGSLVWQVEELKRLGATATQSPATNPLIEDKSLSFKSRPDAEVATPGS